MGANKGRKAFEGAFGEALKGKVDKPVIHPGLLGAYLDDGRPVVTVSNRPDYVWVRIRGATSEPIQAFNDTVGRHFDLPVLVARDENNPIRWKVIARDVGAYADWGGGGYLPSHGLDHSFAGAPNTGGDIAWIYKRQFMPLLPRPSDTGTKSIYVEAGYYFANGKYNWWPGSGSSDFESFQPTGAHNSKFVTVYIDPDDGILQYTAGPEFNAYEPSGTFTNFIALPESEGGIPIAAVYLTSGTQWINWSEIYDLRLAPISTDVSVSGTVIVLDNGVPLGSADRLNFSGPGFVTTISGSYAEIASEDWVETAGDTMTGPLLINTNSAAALVVEQSGVHDDTLVVDTASGRTGFGTPNPVSLVEFSDSSVNMDGGLTLAVGGLTAKSTYAAIAVSGEIISFFGSNVWVNAGLATERFDNTKLAWAFSLDNRTAFDYFNVQRLSSAGVQTYPLVVQNDGGFGFGPITNPTNNTGAKFVMDSSGNVGVGIIVPTARLHIVGDADVVQLLAKGNVAQTENIVEIQDSSGTSFLTVGGNGNVGIGTSSPGFNLEVAGPSNPLIVVTDTTNTVQARLQSFDTNASIGTRSNHLFSIATNNTGRVFVTADGNVGVGIVGPEGKFHIKGTEDATQLIIQGYSTQAEPLQEWQSSSGTVSSLVDPSGYAVFGEPTKQPNAENLQIGGAWTFKETTEPAADADYGKIWTESDNVLYFQDGAGVKHAIGGTSGFKSYTATTQGLGANPDIFLAGFYEWSASDFNFTQAGTSGSFGTGNVSYAAHAFVVAAAVGITDGSDLVLTVTGTSIDDQGNRTVGDSEVIVADATAVSTDQYFETTKKWLGQIMFTLTSTGGTAFSFDFNYGLAKYDDWGNRDFSITDIEAVGFAGASDSDFDVLLLHHRTTGWTYSASTFTPITATNTIVSFAGDHSTDDQLNDGQHFSWKRDDLSTAIDGNGSEGYLILISSSANNAVEYINVHMGVMLK